ncbi:MAG TPA: hypothetical protein VLH09_05445 [Bryobacteraceae bacterium]|nr:hypothetical protein [Bryobacteraceae bacterium]
MYVVRSLAPRYTSVYTPGRAIADIAGDCARDVAASILQPDGAMVGTIVALGLGGKASGPGASAAATVHDLAVVGGTGAFLGARGCAGLDRTVGSRTTSMVEDPANRLIFQLIPMTWPETVGVSAAWIKGPEVQIPVR